ncbi:Ferric uptake regulation protein [compost metagenome]
MECGSVSEFKSDSVRAIQEQVADRYGFRPTRHKLEIYGLCASCVAAGAELPSDGLTCPIETV